MSRPESKPVLLELHWGQETVSLRDPPASCFRHWMWKIAMQRLEDGLAKIPDIDIFCLVVQNKKMHIWYTRSCLMHIAELLVYYVMPSKVVWGMVLEPVR